MKNNAKILVTNSVEDDSCEIEITGKPKEVMALYAALTNDLLGIFINDVGMSEKEAIALITYSFTTAINEEIYWQEKLMMN
jgi:hypothetical protein